MRERGKRRRGERKLEKGGNEGRREGGVKMRRGEGKGENQGEKRRKGRERREWDEEMKNT